MRSALRAAWPTMPADMVLGGLMAIGAIAGVVLDRLAIWLPDQLNRTWLREAFEVSGQPADIALEDAVQPRRPAARGVGIVLVCVAVTYWAAAHYADWWTTVCILPLVWGLLLLSVIDADHQLLPDILVLPLLWLGLIVNTTGLFTSLESAVWGAALGYLGLWSIRAICQRVTGTQGIGLGDAKLLALLGAWGGWQILPTTLMLAVSISLVVILPMVFMGRRDRKAPIAFGPYLAMSGWGALLYLPHWP